MNFTGKTVLVYLEEDNIQRAYFRVRPLLCEEGAVDKQALQEYPDEGYLRIVPDKNEQHTFKDRMRTLCGLCVLNLRDMPADVSKIRTNKNYSPARGENNQFIVYSDAVQAMPRDLFYQVVPEGQLDSALTPLVFTRSGANIQGPFDCTTHQPEGEVIQLPPDSSALYTVQLPDERELLFYCPRTANEEPAAENHIKEEPKAEEVAPAAPAENAEPVQEAKPLSPWKRQLDLIMSGEKPAKPEEPAPVKKAEKVEKAPKAETVEKAEKPAKPDMQNALQQIQQLNGELQVSSRMKDESKSFQPADIQQPQQPLGGTKLYQPATGKKQSGMKAHNALAETVDMQKNPNRYESRYEAPGACISANAQMNDVQNPVEHFRHALQKVWMMPDTHRQVINSLMNIHGMRPALAKALCEGKQDLTLAAMHNQLQELEAERLMTLMQLDDVKAAKQKIKDEVLASLARHEKAAQEKLQQITQEKQSCVEELTKQQDALIKECEAAAKQLNEMPWQDIIAPHCGSDVTEKELMERTLACLKAQGFKATDDDVRALLITLALTDDSLCLLADTRSDARTLASAIAGALGTSSHDVTGLPIRVLNGGDAPVFTCDTESVHRPIKNAVHLILCDKQMNPLTEESEMSEDYYTAPWLAFDVEADDEALPKAMPVYSAVSRNCLKRVMLKDGEVNDAVRKVIVSLCQGLRDAGAALPLKLRSKLCTFILSAQDVMKGGVAAAIDYAVCAIVVPHVQAYALDKDAVLPLLQAMPRALKELEE